MTSLVLLYCLAQAPEGPPTPVAVVVSSKRPGADKFSGPAAARVHQALLREGLKADDALDDVATGAKVRAAGFSDARNCQGGASCLAKLATLLGPNAVVVGVDVGKVGRRLALRLEAVSATTGKSLLVSDVTAPISGWGDKVAVPVALFARQLIDKLAALTPPPPPPPPPLPPVAVKEPEPPEPEVVKIPADAPLATQLTPPPSPPPEKRRSVRPAAIKWTFAIGTAAATGVSVGFLVAGLSARGQLSAKPTLTRDGLRATGYTAAEAERLAGRSNSQLTISLVTGVVAAALLTTATYFFLTE